MHRCKSFGRELFKLVEEKGKELRFDKIDCTHLKCNFTYWLRQNCNEPFHVFIYRFACVLEHHFGCHDFCKGKNEGGWCKYKGDKEMMAKAKEENRYHDKHMEAPLYAAVLTIWRRYATEDMLRQSHHPYWCQKSESLNQLVTVFAPKDKHLSASMSLSDCVSLVVIVDSVGFAQGVCKIMEEIGCDVPASTLECLKRRDAKREYHKIYKNKIENRRRRGEQIRQKIKEAHENRKNDKKNGFKYKPSIVVTGDTAVETVTKKRTSWKWAVWSNEVNDTAVEKKKGQREHQ